MSTQDSIHLTVEQAQKILNEFNCQEANSLESVEAPEKLRQALLLFTHLSDYQNIGICANSADEGFSALEHYLKYLGYPVPEKSNEISQFTGAVYLKYSSLKGSLYIDSYTGSYRGVLFACQSSENESISGTYGHFPLDLCKFSSP